MPNVEKLIQALMKGVAAEIEEYFAKHWVEVKAFKALARDHALLLRERFQPLSEVDAAALGRRIALSEHLMKSQLLTLAIELNKTAWTKEIEKKTNG